MEQGDNTTASSIISHIEAPADWLSALARMRLLTVESEQDSQHLHRKSSRVCVFGQELEQFCQALVEQMRCERGIGLAAPQMGVFQRIFVSQTDEAKPPLIAVNPLIRPAHQKDAEDAAKQRGEEGCLSVPGIYAEVERWPAVDIEAQDPYGKKFHHHLEGLEAICFQHENDHLDGILFIDYLSRSQQRKIKRYFAQLGQ